MLSATVGTLVAGTVAAAALAAGSQVAGSAPSAGSRSLGLADDLAGASRAAEHRAADRRAARRRADSKPSAQPTGTPQQIALALLPRYGWPASQFGCLDALWTRESGWNPYATNPSSGAFGIAQALPASKMATAGADWQTNPATQIRWGLSYIQATYGSPCGAWAHETADGWY
jgi:hypothetical protein